jgi:hypothetical protein
MASSSKPKTDEELESMKAQNNAAAQSLNDRQRVVVGGQALGQSTGDRITMSEDGQSFESDYVGGGGRGKFTFNPITGRYHNHGGDIVDLGEVAQQAPAAAASSGPTAAPTAEPDAPADWREDVDYSKSESPEGMTTEQIVDNVGMDNWMEMGPVTAGQHINPLVDPAKWQYQADPKHQQVRNLGRYVNPLIAKEMEERQNQGVGMMYPGGGLLGQPFGKNGGLL